MQHPVPLDDIMNGVLALCTLMFALIISIAMWREKNKDSVMWGFTGVVTFLTVALGIYIAAKGYAWFTAHILYLP